MPRPLEDLDDAAVAVRALAGQDPGQASAVVETLFRTRDALVQQQEATNRLTERIERLNWWLLVFAIAGTPIAVVSLAIAFAALILKS